MLIHIDPATLPEVHDSFVRFCFKYLIVAEYYNRTPVAISYRGHRNRLFKRDFANEILDRHTQMELLDYGFVYSPDVKFPQDDVTLFVTRNRS